MNALSPQHYAFVFDLGGTATSSSSLHPVTHAVTHWRSVAPHDGQNQQLLCLILQVSRRHRSPSPQLGLVGFRKSATSSIALRSAIVDIISAFAVCTMEEANTRSTFITQDPPPDPLITQDPFSLQWFALKKLVLATASPSMTAPPPGLASCLPWVPWDTDGKLGFKVVTSCWAGFLTLDCLGFHSFFLLDCSVGP